MHPMLTDDWFPLFIYPSMLRSSNIKYVTNINIADSDVNWKGIISMHLLCINDRNDDFKWIFSSRELLQNKCFK